VGVGGGGGGGKGFVEVQFNLHSHMALPDLPTPFTKTQVTRLKRSWR